MWDVEVIFIMLFRFIVVRFIAVLVVVGAVVAVCDILVLVHMLPVAMVVLVPLRTVAVGADALSTPRHPFSSYDRDIKPQYNSNISTVWCRYYRQPSDLSRSLAAFSSEYIPRLHTRVVELSVFADVPWRRTRHPLDKPTLPRQHPDTRCCSV